MAESIFSDLIRRRGWVGKVACSSAAATRDAIGCPPHRGTRQKLAEVGIPLVPHIARLLTREDGARYDYIVGMDSENLWDMREILGKPPRARVMLLLDCTDSPRDVADPWYTGDFEASYADITVGCEALANLIAERPDMTF